jgi:hypothetical protein
MKKKIHITLLLILIVSVANLNSQTLTQKFYLDFGKSDIINGNLTEGADINGVFWNNIVSSETGSPSIKPAGYTVSLINSANTATTYTLETNTSFSANGKNNGALLSPNPTLLGDLAIATATEDYFFIEDNQKNKGEFILKNLDPTKAYKFYVFGSRLGTGDRVSILSINGLNGSHGTLKTTGTAIGTNIENTNDNTIWKSGLIIPKSNGEISFEIGIATGGYAYINAMKIEEYANFTLPVAEKKIYIDFGKNNNGLDGTLTLGVDQNGNYWNNMYSNGDGPTSGATNPTLSLILSNNTGSGYLLEAGNTFSFNGVRNGGLLAPQASLLNDLAVATATHDYLFIQGEPNATLYFKNLNTSKRYRFSVFGSRIQSSGDPRIGILEISGANSIKGIHQMGGVNMCGTGVHQNTKNIFVSDPIAPDINGKITLLLTKWLGGFAHINTIKLEEIEADQQATSIEVTGNGISSCGQTSQMRINTIPENITLPNAIWSVDNSNVAWITESGKLYAKSNGEVTVTATVNYPNGAILTASKEITIVNQGIATHSLAIMGSSVPAGAGAEANKGYAQLWAQWLSEQSSNQWTTSNISIGGNNTTDVTNRWDRDLLPTCSKYVYYGLSLGNEGIHERGETAFNSYRDNMLLLLERSRVNGIIPLMGNNYPRGDFNATDYDYVKKLNLLIHEWDVPSINLLGSIDNGFGRWATGYIADNAHPNTVGHAEMFYAFVPSLLDALASGKPQPKRPETRTQVTLGREPAVKRIAFTPENVAHSFTLSFSFRTNYTGTLASIVNNNKSVAYLKISNEGQLAYETQSSQDKLISQTSVNDGAWHQISLTHYYAWGKTILYLDGVPVTWLMKSEKLTPTKFYLNDFTHPIQTVDFSELFFHRAAMNANEIQALHGGKMLKSSLEIYAPLDGNKNNEHEVLANEAQSFNTLTFDNQIGTSIETNEYENINNIIFKEITLFSTTGQKLAIRNNASLTAFENLRSGSYILKLRTKEGYTFSRKISIN